MHVHLDRNGIVNWYKIECARREAFSELRPQQFVWYQPNTFLFGVGSVDTRGQRG